MATSNSVILDSGLAYLARLLTGDTVKRPNGMYVEFCNGTPSLPDIVPSRSLSYYQSLSGSYWYARVAFPGVGMSASPGEALFSAQVVVGSEAPSPSGGKAVLSSSSQLYAATLIYIPDAADMYQDQLIAVQNFMSGTVATPVPMVINASVMVTMSLQFLN